MKKIKHKITVKDSCGNWLKVTKINLECDKCGGKVEKTKLKKHLGNKVYHYEYQCKICGITEWLNKEYPLLKK